MFSIFFILFALFEPGDNVNKPLSSLRSENLIFDYNLKHATNDFTRQWCGGTSNFKHLTIWTTRSEGHLYRESMEIWVLILNVTKRISIELTAEKIKTHIPHYLIDR